MIFLNIIIYRGTHQIGGCVTEISTVKTRLIIDFGKELPDENNIKNHNTLMINGVSKKDKTQKCDGVLFTHYHDDHMGLIDEIISGVPLYMGEASKEIYYANENHKRTVPLDTIKKISTFKNGERFLIGDIYVTPIMVDHSAFDAYMFLIEAEGKKVLHTGDYRGHGIKGYSLLSDLKRNAGVVDVVITEGTTLSKPKQIIKTEKELEETASFLLNQYKYVFVICSPTNIDRISSFLDATSKSKYFICDSYQMEILDIARKYGSIYSSNYKFANVIQLNKDLEIEKRGFTMMVRANRKFERIMENYKNNFQESTLVIYSMWSRYLKKAESSANKLLKGFKYVVKLHTGGHGSVDFIEQVCSALQPTTAVIPIHTEKPENIKLGKYQNKLVLLNDGEKYSIE